jgi:leucyl-tRNA synthetase
VVVQVNGKVRAELVVSPDIAEADIKAQALAHESVQKWLEGREPKKIIYVPGRLVSIVV